jgi:hypothetical protein
MQQQQVEVRAVLALRTPSLAQPLFMAVAVAVEREQARAQLV